MTMDELLEQHRPGYSKLSKAEQEKIFVEWRDAEYLAQLNDCGEMHIRNWHNLPWDARKKALKEYLNADYVRQNPTRQTRRY